jgi:hypothetical protein
VESAFALRVAPEWPRSISRGFEVDAGLNPGERFTEVSGILSGIRTGSCRRTWRVGDQSFRVLTDGARSRRAWSHTAASTAVPPRRTASSGRGVGLVPSRIEVTDSQGPCRGTNSKLADIGPDGYARLRAFHTSSAGQRRAHSRGAKGWVVLERRRRRRQAPTVVARGARGARGARDSWRVRARA